MNHHYNDIRTRIDEPPVWFDERAVPRYCCFAPGETANIYCNETALVVIACQACGERFNVCFSQSRIDIGWILRYGAEPQPTLADKIRDGSIHYGDPPNTDCCAAGATMNCDDLRVLEYWYRDEVGFGWKRDASLEVEIDES